MAKPPLTTHFLHAGPALADLNSLASLVTAPAQTQPNPPGSTTSTRPIAGLSLPPPVACSPFNAAENASIQLAWQTLNQQHHPSPCSLCLPLDSPRACPRCPLDRKGKGKLVTDPVIGKDNLATNSSGTNSHLTDAQEDDQNYDGVLNLSIESQPHIVPVGLDSLFTVDVKRLKLYPAFWHGPQLDVYQGEWFYPSTSKHKFYPCAPELSRALEAAYDQIKPWDLSYQDELRSALKIGTEAEDKLKAHLGEFNHDVIFQSATQGRLYSTGVSSRISKTILTNFFTSISKNTAGHSGGTVVVRGWDEAQSWSGLLAEDHVRSDQEMSSPSEEKDVQSVDAPSGFHTTADMLQEEVLENSNIQVSELVLVIHGIGQKLAQSYDSFDFVHACNQLRLECHKASTTDPKMKDFLQNKRAQFIPIRWRHSLNFEMEGYEAAENEMKEKVSKNTFTMKDIQIPDSIQFVREIVTGLVLDVPLYMSPKQHKRMVAAVIEQANKVYQLFCHRNPYYTGKKVSILAHSLGAALTVDILSRQPNVWTMEVPAGEIMDNTLEYLSTLNHFCFDTSKVFLVGSPVAFFFHLHRAQLIAREEVSKLARCDTNHSSEWRKINRITAAEAGQYGCLAAETIYNVYVSTDPVAYCVDTPHSKRIRPIDAQSLTKQFLELMKRKRGTSEGGKSIARNLSLSSLSSLVGVNSWLGGGLKKEPSSEDPMVTKAKFIKLNQVASMANKKPSLTEIPTRPSSLVGGWSGFVRKHTTTPPLDISNNEPIKKSKVDNPLGPLRFQALNPTGSIDFVIPSLGLNQYVDMVTAHAAYWTDIRFARLILVALFAQDLDLNLIGEKELEPYLVS